MKRIKDIYKIIENKDYIRKVIILASKGKTKRREVKNVLNNLDYYVDEIYNMVIKCDFKLRKTHHREIIEKGKIRELTISPFFPNRILDYLMVETLKPYIRKSMYIYCIGNVDKKGMVYGKNVISKKYHKYKYYIKLDIHKFYPSVKSQVLYDFITTKIKDKKMLKLCYANIMFCNGMPIGSYYSQWFSNWLLQDLDHSIKEKQKIPFYVRYVDDMLLMSDNKKQLIRTMYYIKNWLNNKNLELKRIEQVYSVENRPIDFLGFRFCKDKVLLRIRNFKNLNKKIRKVRKRKNVSLSQAKSIMSLLGWLKQIKLGYLYYRNHIKDFIKIGTLKYIISSYA